MSDTQRIIEYNKTIKHKPIPSEFAVIIASQLYYGIEIDPTDT